MHYRVAEVTDAHAVAEFGARLFVDSYAHLMERRELEAYVAHHFTPERQRVELADARLTTFLADADVLIGYAQIAEGNLPECPITATTPAELKRIYVDERWHGRGVARELLQLIEQEASRRNCDVLWLAVWEINDRAISFYRKNGFEIVGRQGFPIGHEVQTDHVMAKPVAKELP